MPERPPKGLRQKVAEAKAMSAAQKSAQQTPQEVRDAFLARRKTIGPVFVEPFSLGILWLFEALAHPFNEGAQLKLDGDGKPIPMLDPATRAQKQDANGAPLFETVPLSVRDTARAIYAFHDSEGAAEALAGGIEAFDAEAMTLARAIEPALLPQISQVIYTTYAEGLATIPGAGGSNPRRTGS